jgi:hypothetical protein
LSRGSVGRTFTAVTSVDTARAGKVNSSWSEIFGSWHPEHDREEEWPNLPAEEIARRQAHKNAAVDVLVASKTELEHLRDNIASGLTTGRYINSNRPTIRRGRRCSRCFSRGWARSSVWLLRPAT